MPLHVETQNRIGPTRRENITCEKSPPRSDTRDPFMRQWERELGIRMRRQIHEILDLDHSPVLGGTKI